MKREFTIPNRLPGLNEIINASRGNRYGANAQKIRVEKKIIWCIKEAKIKKCKEPITLSVVFFEKNKRRDPDNIISGGMKHILDAMKTAKIIKNDGWKNIELIESYWFLDRENPRIEVTIYEAEEE